MKMTYDPNANAVYVRLIDGSSTITRTMSGDEPDMSRIMGHLIFDFDENGRIVGIEILNADQLLPTKLLQP